MSARFLGVNLEQIGARQVLNALADGVYITDVHRTIVFWNRAASQITGWQSEEVVGHSCGDNILVHVDVDGHQLCGQEHCPLHRSVVTGVTSSEPLLVFAKHKSGQQIPVEVSVSPIRDSDGQIVGGIEVFRDLTAMVDDLKRARIIQDHALESKLPEDTRVRFQVAYTPEEIVGGDFYRVEQIDPDRYAIMVADVMGHGAASALYTMQLRSLWEDCRARLGSPRAFISELNQRLGRLVSADGYFATATFLTVNVADGTFSYVRAGSPPALIFQAGGAVKILNSPSPAIGIFENQAYTEVADRLQPGDTLLLFTDGAIEIENAAGEELDLTGFLELLRRENFSSGQASLAEIERALLKFGNGIRLSDDLTLLSIHRTASAKT